MIWPVVAQDYMQTFERAWQERAALPRVAFTPKRLPTDRSNCRP